MYKHLYSRKRWSLIGLIAGLIAVVSGCDAGDPFASKTCAMELVTHGGAELEVGASEDPACVVSGSFDEGISFAIVRLSPMTSLTVSIESVTRGEVGTSFPAEVSIAGSDANEFTTMDCVVVISEHDLVGPTNGIDGSDDYRVRGTGMCSDAVDAQGQSLTVEPFEFVVAVPWATSE